MAERGIKLFNSRSKFNSRYRNETATYRGAGSTASTTSTERRNGRLYLTGLAVSVIGNNAMSLAAGIWVKALTGSSSEAALASVCVYAPSLAGPVAGVVADRVRRRRFLVRLNVVSAALLLPLLAVRGAGSVWIIFAAMTWYGIHLTLSSPAEDALFAVMLSGELRQELNGWRLGLQETGRLVSPLFGAGLFALVGGGTVSVFDAVTFVIAAVMLSRIRLREAMPVPEPRHWRADLLAGFGHIRATPQLRRLLVAASVVMSFSAVLVAAQYSLVQGLGEPPSFLGVFSAGLGAGSVVASLVSGRLLKSAGERRLAVLGMADFAVGNALKATGWLPLAIAGSVVLGFALPWLFLALLNLAQRCTPPELQGRVSAAVSLAFFGPQAPLQALGALAIRYASYQELYLAGAAVAVATAIVFTCQARRSPG
ncbi:MAG TPA: MFS transporter [Streptosporangiaceae bacterium]|nr:MFS transporter [Streptosporangiaceae bacterium]